jgi:hypothetical protein
MAGGEALGSECFDYCIPPFFESANSLAEFLILSVTSGFYGIRERGSGSGRWKWRRARQACAELAVLSFELCDTTF